TWKCTSAPSERPIQFRCSSFSDSGQSIVSRSVSNLSAYAVIRSIHCRISFRTTGCPPTSLFPSITSSLDRPVPSSGHPFTGVSATYASRLESRYSRLCSSLFTSAGYASFSIGSVLFVVRLNHELYSFRKIHCDHLKYSGSVVSISRDQS